MADIRQLAHEILMGANTSFPLVWMYRLLVLLCVVTVLLIQVHVHEAAIDGTEAAESITAVSEATGWVLMILVVCWLVPTLYQSWQAYRDQADRAPSEVAD